MDPEWKLLLTTGFGNVFPLGRWDVGSTVIVARAVNTGDWRDVTEYANEIPWLVEHAN